MIKYTILLLLVTLFSCSKNSSHDKNGYISLTPSISEVFVYLDKANELKGRTQYCTHKELDSVEIIGTILSPSLEKIYALQPKAVIVLESQKNYLKFPDNYNVLTVDQNSVDAIFSSVDSIAKVLHIVNCKKESQKSKVNEMRNYFKQKKEKSALCIVSVNEIAKNNISFYIASQNTYYNDICTIFNIKNSTIESNPPYQQQSLEYIEQLKPDIIFNFSNNELAENIKNALSYSPEFITITDKFASIPGPISVNMLLDSLYTVLK